MTAKVGIGWVRTATVSINSVDYKVWRSTATYNDIAPLDMLIEQNPVL